MAGAVLAELLGQGVRDVVLCPGSRSAPLALAIADAAEEGYFRLFVRVDERGAGFLALGLARATGAPVAVACTSGTAVANLMPAVVEASYSGIPLVCVTADRPPELRNTGANQTIDQRRIFGDHVRYFAQLDPGDGDGDSGSDPGSARGLAEARAAVRAALRVVTHGRAVGPVHVNVGFRDPLVPDDGESLRALWSDPVADTEVRSHPHVQAGAAVVQRDPPRLDEVLRSLGRDSVPRRGLIVAGDIPGPDTAQSVADLSEITGWPVLAEPSANVRCEQAISHFVPLLTDRHFRAAHRPDLILTVGRFGLSRPTLALVREAPLHVAVRVAGRDRPDPARTAAVVLSDVPVVDASYSSLGVRDPGWLGSWTAASRAAGRAVRDVLDPARFNGIDVARMVVSVAARGDTVLLGPSRSVRDVQDYADAPRAGVRVVGNRGASGIDGLVSTAWGLALGSSGRTFALLGDLSFLHDVGALLAPRIEPSPQLTIVVVDNNGGGIFSSLEPGRPAFARHFERVFGTPHDRDLLAVVRGFGMSAEQATDRESLAAILAEEWEGARVVVADVGPRNAEQGLREQVAAAVSVALSSRR